MACWSKTTFNCESNAMMYIRLISQNLVEKSFLADCNYWQCLTWYCSCRITVLLQQTSDLLTVCAISRIKSALEFSIMHLVAFLLSKSSCRAIWAFPNQKASQTFSFSGWGLLSIGLIRSSRQVLFCNVSEVVNSFLVDIPLRPHLVFLYSARTQPNSITCAQWYVKSSIF